MAGYVKLFGSLLDSSIMDEPVITRWVWVVVLAMKDRDGRVEATVGGLARRAAVTREQAEEALRAFLSPDPDSRTTALDGRRLVEIEGGWQVVNHDLYHAKDNLEDRREKTRIRVARHRARRAAAVSSGSAPTETETESNAGNGIRSDPDPDPDQRRGGDAPHNWTAHDWHRKFGAAWSRAYNVMHPPGGGDASARATGDLVDQLRAMAPEARLAAQERAHAMFSEYLGRGAPAIVQARHPWSWFVRDFSGLLVPARAPDTPDAPGYHRVAAGVDYTEGLDLFARDK
jgi:hypothetical protein